MSASQVSDAQVVFAYQHWQQHQDGPRPHLLLERWTSVQTKQVWQAIERAHKRGYLEQDLSLDTAWPTLKGKKLSITVEQLQQFEKRAVPKIERPDQEELLRLHLPSTQLHME